LFADLPWVGEQSVVFDAWTPDPGIRQAVFVDNPERLYGRATSRLD
jgi:hypothetical protein